MAAPHRLRQLAPWLVAGATLAWLFHVVPLDALGAALRRASPWQFGVLVVVFVVGTLVADSFATWATFRWALPEAGLQFGEALEVRGASYLLAIIHYGAGQGGLAYFVNRVHKVPLARAAGAVLLIMGVNVVVVALSALVGVLLGGAPAAPALRALVIALACAFPAYLAVIAARPRLLLRRALLAPLFDAGLTGHAVAAVARLPHISWLLVGHYTAMRLFGVDPPVVTALALLPVVFVVTVLPISPSGIGTAQATAVALFAGYAEGGSPAAREAAVLAYGLALTFAALVVQAVLGLGFLRRLGKAVTVGEKDSLPA
jgi:hypothetical protein